MTALTWSVSLFTVEFCDAPEPKHVTKTDTDCLPTNNSKESYLCCTYVGEAPLKQPALVSWLFYVMQLSRNESSDNDLFPSPLIASSVMPTSFPGSFISGAGAVRWKSLGTRLRSCARGRVELFTPFVGTGIVFITFHLCNIAKVASMHRNKEPLRTQNMSVESDTPGSENRINIVQRNHIITPIQIRGKGQYCDLPQTTFSCGIPWFWSSRPWMSGGNLTRPNISSCQYQSRLLVLCGRFVVDHYDYWSSRFCSSQIINPPPHTSDICEKKKKLGHVRFFGCPTQYLGLADKPMFPKIPKVKQHVMSFSTLNLALFFIYALLLSLRLSSGLKHLVLVQQKTKYRGLKYVQH